MQIRVIDTSTGIVELDGRHVSLRELEAAAHQDDPVWLHRAGLAPLLVVPPPDAETRRLAEQYREILARVQAAVDRARRIERLDRLAACPGHRAVRETGPLPYVCGVATREWANPMAHGGVRWIEHCDCTATREMLSNGPHTERGPWR